jgi:hypothetical protein
VQPALRRVLRTRIFFYFLPVCLAQRPLPRLRSLARVAAVFSFVPPSPSVFLMSSDPAAPSSTPVRLSSATAIDDNSDPLAELVALLRELALSEEYSTPKGRSRSTR